MREAIDGGLPCLKGVGPALTVEAEIARYRVSHPGATWAEMLMRYRAITPPPARWSPATGATPTGGR